MIQQCNIQFLDIHHHSMIISFSYLKVGEFLLLLYLSALIGSSRLILFPLMELYASVLYILFSSSIDVELVKVFKTSSPACTSSWVVYLSLVCLFERGFSNFELTLLIFGPLLSISSNSLVFDSKFLISFCLRSALCNVYYRFALIILPPFYVVVVWI